MLPASVFLRLLRPGFLLVTVSACAIGFAAALHEGASLRLLPMLVVTLLALVAHAAGNVINDVEDAVSGTDAVNTEGLFPFTGGSRLIHSGTVELRMARRLGRGLLAASVIAGAWFALHHDRRLLWIGALGVLLAWGYSTPPLRFMSRGIGEGVIALAWALVTLGAHDALAGTTTSLGWQVGLGHAGLVAAILLANGFPDARSDAATGKRTLVVRLGRPRAALAFGVLVVAAHALSLTVLWHAGVAMWAWPLASMPLSAAACAGLVRHAESPAHLRPTLVLNILASVVHAAAVIAALLA